MNEIASPINEGNDERKKNDRFLEKLIEISSS